MWGLEWWVRWVNGEVWIVVMAQESREKKQKGTMNVYIYWPLL